MKSRTLPCIILALLIIALFTVIPASAVKTSEQSVSDSLTRGSRFTVTITGLPNSSYYIWLPRTFTMTGKSGDQPPVIADNILNVSKDPAGGPYPIGSYQYNNGDGRTIRDDIAPSTAEMSNTNYYAQVTTDTGGQAVVEFQTSFDTGLRSYSVRVENPDSADSDNLLVEITVFSRKAPTMVILTPETTRETVVITPTATRVESPGIPVLTTTAVPAVTSVPVPVPTTKAAAGLFPIACALFTVALSIRMRR
jgi:hypothetical protein